MSIEKFLLNLLSLGIITGYESSKGSSSWETKLLIITKKEDSQKIRSFITEYIESTIPSIFKIDVYFLESKT